MKKKYIILIVVCVVIIALAVVYCIVNTHNPSIISKNGLPAEKAVAVYSISHEGILTVNDSLRFRFDTGTASSSITKDDLHRLQNMGIEVKTRSFPVLARTANSEKLYFSKGVVISALPFYEMRHFTDQGHYGHYESTGKIAGYLNNMVFMPARENDTISVIGMDMLEHFVVEISEANKAVSLRLTVPDNYQYVMDMDRSQSILGLLSDAHRFYLPLSVQNNESLYRIDTGLEQAELKLPADDSIRVNGCLNSVILRTPRGAAPAKYAESVWVKLGNRQGSYGAHFTDEGIEAYALNPLNFFDQDIVLDFPGRKFYLHPHSNLIDTAN